MPMTHRFHPNIIITGTPGCGKSSHATSLVSVLNREFPDHTYTHLDISTVAKERECIDSYDARLDTSVVDEDKLLDLIEDDLKKGGNIVDWHCCDVFPERLIDLVVVLRTDSSLLHSRLTKRNYSQVKITENLDCEIMEVILQEARDSYIPEIVIELASNTADEMDENVDRIVAWTHNWIKDNPKGVTNLLNLISVNPQDGGSQGDDSEDEDDSENFESDSSDDSRDTYNDEHAEWTLLYAKDGTEYLEKMGNTNGKKYTRDGDRCDYLESCHESEDDEEP